MSKCDVITVRRDLTFVDVDVDCDLLGGMKSMSNGEGDQQPRTRRRRRERGKTENYLAGGKICFLEEKVRTSQLGGNMFSLHMKCTLSKALLLPGLRYLFTI